MRGCEQKRLEEKNNQETSLTSQGKKKRSSGCGFPRWVMLGLHQAASLVSVPLDVQHDRGKRAYEGAALVLGVRW